MIPNTTAPVKDWSEALTRVFGPRPPSSGEWTKMSDITRHLRPFVQPMINHTMLPGGGGYDMVSVAEAGDMEDGCLEFCVSRAEDLDKEEDPGTAGTQADVVFVCKPRSFRFEHFPDSPVNSFFLLETRRLDPSGVYENMEDPFEEVLQVGPYGYRMRSCYEAGNLGRDAQGREIPLPPKVRLVTRYLQPGKFLVVAKESLWFKRQASYDARHNKMTAKEIRAEIQAMIEGREVR